MKEKTQQSAKELRILFSEADKRLSSVERDLDVLMSLMEKFQDVEHNMGVLNSFYHSNVWMEGRDKLSELFPDEHFDSAGEDSIWNASQRLYALRIRLIKLLADSLYNDFPNDLK